MPVPTPGADLLGLDPSDPLGSAVNVRAYFVTHGSETAPIAYLDAYAVGCYEVVSGSHSDWAGTGRGVRLRQALKPQRPRLLLRRPTRFAGRYGRAGMSGTK